MKTKTTLLAIILAIALAGCSAGQGTLPEVDLIPSGQGTATPELQAIAEIRTALELPDLPLEYVGTESSGNAPYSGTMVNVYQDSAGRKYSVEVATMKVIEVDARSVLNSIPAEVELMPEEINAKAWRLMRAAIPGFDALQSGLTYEEGGKVDNFFFAWYGVMEPGMFNRPFAQIAIHKSGIVFAYYNMLGK